MKRFCLLFLLSVLIINNTSAQDDELLKKRIDEILVYTQQKNTEKILDYTNPKLFEFITREQMAAALSSMYDTDEFITDLDSLFTIKIHPVFTLEGKQYCKIIHNMAMRMKFKEAADTTSDENIADFMVQLMGEKYGKDNVRFDAKNNTLVIKLTSEMLAVKESDTWYFTNYDENSPMIDLLFSKAVQKKYKEFK